MRVGAKMFLRGKAYCTNGWTDLYIIKIRQDQKWYCLGEIGRGLGKGAG